MSPGTGVVVCIAQRCRRRGRTDTVRPAGRLVLVWVSNDPVAIGELAARLFRRAPCGSHPPRQCPRRVRPTNPREADDHKVCDRGEASPFAVRLMVVVSLRRCPVRGASRVTAFLDARAPVSAVGSQRYLTMSRLSDVRVRLRSRQQPRSGVDVRPSALASSLRTQPCAASSMVV
jgi:hypothetical protein